MVEAETIEEAAGQWAIDTGLPLILTRADALLDDVESLVVSRNEDGQFAMLVLLADGRVFKMEYQITRNTEH
jgi:hypothetical protein